MKNASHRYARLLKAQNLVRMREKMVLATSRHALAALEEENRYILSLMHRITNTGVLDPSLISSRSEHNRRRERQIEAKIMAGAGTLVQASRRCDILQKKKKEALKEEERRDFAHVLEDYIALRYPVMNRRMLLR